MPRDGSNIYHVPVGTDAVTDTTIDSAKYNIYIHDVETDLNAPRPISAGGTGATGPDQGLVNLSGEKAAQIVTNWDSMLWAPGSFYAGTSASGIAPVVGHKFSGICYLNEPLAYPPTNLNLVCEATDLTDVSDPTNIPQYIRVMTAGVWGSWIKKNNAPPIPGSLGEYTFDSGITFPPGSGQVRFNNATQNSTTEIFISHTTATGIDNSGVIPFALKSGYDFYIQDKDEPAKWKMFTATADPVLSGGDFRVTATFKSGGTDLVTANRMLFGANSGASASTYAVRYDAAQTLTLAQQSQARSNIAVAKKNYLLNGAMQTSQQNGMTAGTVNGFYPADQWYIEAAGQTTGAFSIAQFASPTPGGSSNRIRLTVTAAQASYSSGAVDITQRIEGFRVADLMWGTATAKTIVLQFGVKAPAGTYGANIYNSGQATAVGGNFTIAAGEANTDVVKQIVYTGPTTGTWLKDNGIGLWVSIYLAASGQANIFATNGNIFELFDVSLTEGAVAPPFVVPDCVIDLASCQRYWQKSHSSSVRPGTPVAVSGGLMMAHSTDTAYAFSCVLPVTLRVSPTVTLYDNGGNAGFVSALAGGWGNGATMALGIISDKGFFVSGAIAGTSYLNFDWTVSARL